MTNCARPQKGGSDDVAVYTSRAVVGFIRYPGGKTKLRSKIAWRLAEQAGRDGLQYREPFFGGGGVGLTLLPYRQHVRDFWINDADVGVACLWTAVIRHPEDFKKRVLNFAPSVGAFHELREELLSISGMPERSDEVVDIGFKKLAIHQTSYSGLGTKSGGPLGGRKQTSKCKIDSRWSSEHICKEVDKIHRRFAGREIRGGGCTNLDFSELIEDTSCPALLYLDPPYYVKGNGLYQHGFTRDDHERLASALQKTKHAWVLSYDDTPEIRELYGWATIDQAKVSYTIATGNCGGAGSCAKKTELLIYRGGQGAMGREKISQRLCITDKSRYARRG
jgi:DNA adenine methylase